jgi:hypothetical protein
MLSEVVGVDRRLALGGKSICTMSDVAIVELRAAVRGISR